MERLGNEGSVTASNRNAGGIFGCNMSAAATPIFINCYVSGPVKGNRESGQITGYAANGQAVNCYGSGTIEGYYYSDMSDAMMRGKPQCTNCYSTTPDKCVDIVTQEQVANGELCYLLTQGDGLYAFVWYQTLCDDDHPVLNATHSKVLLADDGTYYNEDNSDGLNVMAEERRTAEVVFNLSGQQIVNGKSSNRQLPRGIYIVGGKKVVIR